MFVNKVMGSVRHKLGIQTKAEKVAQKKFNQELQAAVDKLSGKRDIFVKNSDGTIKTLQITDKEVELINEGHARILKKAGIKDIANDPNYDRHNLERFDDVWNPYRRS